MSDVFPIREISSYNRKWKIKARVTSKTNLREYARNGESSSVFSVDFLDAAGGEIRASFFGEAATAFYEVLQKGKVYTVANGSVKVANKRYNSLNHNYEIAFANKTSEVKEVEDDTGIDQMNWSIQSIRSLMNKQPPFNADICGTIHKFDAASTIRTKKDDREVYKRNVSVADSSGSSIDITLWGELAEMSDTCFEGNPTVAFKSVGIRDWGTRTGSLSTKTNFVADPENPDIKKQTEWWKSSGSSAEFTNLTQVQSGGMGAGKTPWVSVAEAKMQGQDQVFLSGNDSKYFNIFVRLQNIRSNDRDGKPQYPYYLACPKCQRKVDGSDHCVEHGQVQPTVRYMFSAAFADKSDNIWLTNFDDSGKNVFHMAADKLKDQIDGMAPEKFPTYLKNFASPVLYRLVVRCKPDEYQGERKPKYSGVRCEVAPPAEATKFLFDQLMQAAGSDIPSFSRAVALAQ